VTATMPAGAAFLLRTFFEVLFLGENPVFFDEYDSLNKLNLHLTPLEN
jgi:hypothetical protein